jgi:glucose-1-phosphate thymidylyltransferase
MRGPESLDAIVLAAGYATRLYPLTLTVAKPLLPVGGRPMLDWILDRIGEVDEVGTVHVVTNSKFARDFERWAKGKDVRVHDDGTSSEHDRRGAIGDVRFVVDEAGIGGDGLLVVAGDNLFDYSLGDYFAFWRGKADGSAVALHDVGSLELVKQYGVVELDANDRLLSFVEKPEAPASTLAATATYLYHPDHVPLLDTYAEEGNSLDKPGEFIAWLCEREPVYGYRFAGEWMDIGDRNQLREADNRMRQRRGMSVRDEYTPDLDTAAPDVSA